MILFNLDMTIQLLTKEVGNIMNCTKDQKKFISIEDPNVKHILSSSFNPKRDYVYDEIYKWLEEQNAKK